MFVLRDVATKSCARRFSVNLTRRRRRSEFVAERSNALFWAFVDAVGVVGSERSDEQVFAHFRAKASALLAAEEMALFDMALGKRSSERASERASVSWRLAAGAWAAPLCVCFFSLLFFCLSARLIVMIKIFLNFFT